MFYEFGGTELMKILVLTSVYPQPDDDKYTGVTPVVHYYAKEWAKAGHDVLVIHNANKFILPVYLLPKSLKRKINSIMGIGLPAIKPPNRFGENPFICYHSNQGDVS